MKSNYLEAYNVMFRHYPDVVDVAGMRSMLGGIGEKTAYKMLREGQVKSVRAGRNYRIPKLAVISYLLNEAEPPGRNSVNSS